MVREDDVEIGADILGHLFQVLLVVLGDDNVLDAGAVGRQHLVLDGADGQDFAPQGDLAGHGDIAADGTVGQRGDEGGGHGDAGRRAVLGYGAGRGGDVHVILLEVGGG